MRLLRQGLFVAAAAALAGQASGQVTPSQTSAATATRTASARVTATLPPGTTPSATASASRVPLAPNEYAMSGRNAQRTGLTPWLAPLVRPVLLGAGVYSSNQGSLGATVVDANGTAYTLPTPTRR